MGLDTRNRVVANTPKACGPLASFRARGSPSALPSCLSPFQGRLAAGWVMLAIESFLQPISTENPSGEAIAGSPGFRELERTAAGKPERQIGSVVEAAEPPNWNTVLDLSQTLLLRSKDLRVAVHCVRALLALRGLAGLAEGLALARGLVERFWDDIHPQLDREDGDDPTARISAMTGLVGRETVLAIRSTALLRSKTLPVVTLREVEAAAKASGASSNAANLVDAAFHELADDELQTLARVAANCSDEAEKLDTVWSARLAGLPRRGPDFGELRRVLFQIASLASNRLKERQSTARPFEKRNGAQFGSEEPSEIQGGTPSAPREIRSRADVVRMLDALCKYFDENEPSSPLPLLLERCKRLVTMSFFEIVKDMIPDGVSAVQTIAGKRDA